jgi:hypothetical protein
MNKVTRTFAPTILLAYSMSLVAQTDGGPLKAYISFGQNVAQNHSLSMTGVPWGGVGCYHAEVGLEFLHTPSTLLVRPNAGYTRILSNPADPERGEWGELLPIPTVYDLLGVFIGFYLVYNVSKKLPITVTAGPSAHSWTVEQSTNVPVGFGGDARQMGEKRLKLGWRTGIGYGFKDDKFRVDFTYTMTEWRSNSTLPRVEGFNPSLPSYFTLKASYTF